MARCGSGPRTAPPALALTGHSDWVDAVAIAPDGSAPGHQAGRRRGADLGAPDRPPAHQLTGHTEFVSGARWRAYAPDGTPWPPPASTARCGSGTPRTATPRTTLVGHHGAVTAVAYHPDGTMPGHHQRRRHGADLGHPHRPPPPIIAHPARCLGGLSRLTAPPLPSPAATARCGSGPAHGHPPHHPHRPPRTGDRGGRSRRTAPWLVTASDDGTVRIWAARTGRRTSAHRPPRGCYRWPTRPTARPWPPAATTARRGSGTPAPASAPPAHRPPRPGDLGGQRA